MPTLTEAAHILHISEKTLRKWMKRLNLAPERHAYDLRYFTITPEQLETIREARAQMPSAQQTPVLYKNALRAKSDGSVGSEASPIVTPAPRQRPLQRATVGALPDGMMAKEDASRLHGVPTSTLRRWCRDGRVETRQGTYAGEHGRYGIVNPITARGLSNLYALAHQRPDFTPCPDCPHDSAGDAGDAGDAGQTPEAVAMPPASEVASE